MVMFPRYVLARALCLLFALPTAAHADSVIDAFQSPFGPETIPVAAPTLWVGTDDGHSQLQDSRTNQGPLASVQGQYRSAALSTTLASNYITTDIDPDTSTLWYSTSNAGTSGKLQLTYGGSPSGPTGGANLNLNLSSDRYFQLSIAGLPHCTSMKVTIAVTCGTSTQAVQKTYSLGNGTVKKPFTDFAGCNFVNVKRIVYVFDASALSGADFRVVGGLRTVFY